MVKDILVWVIDTRRYTVALYSKQRIEILPLLEIPPTQSRISVKNLERLVGKIRSMHLAVSASIGHFYAMQVDLTHDRAAKNTTSNLSAQFHQDIKLLRSLCVKMTTRPTYLAELVHRASSGIGYTGTPGQGAGEV